MQKRCNKCKTVKLLDSFHNASKGSDLKQCYCKDCARDITKAFRAKNKEKYRKEAYEYSRTDHGRYVTAKRAAASRGYSFSLTFDQFLVFIKSECFYCDGMFPKTVVGSNIDRKDGSIGYEYHNCLPCCNTCNKIRNTFLTVEETVVAIHAIINFRKTKNKSA